MAKNSVYIGVVVLAIIAVVLGYQIYQQQAGSKTPPGGQTQDRSVPQTVGKQGSPSTSTTDSQGILNFPASNASQEEILKWTQLVDASAQQVTRVDITGCKSQPLVLSAALDTTFSMKNGDSIDHKIKYADREYIVPAKGEKEFIVKRDFKDALGKLGYDCDGKLAGIITVVK